MLNLYQSNHLDVLVTLLTSQLSATKPTSVLAQEVILVQSPGMSQWLKLQIAEHTGIAANLDFPLPSSFIWKLYQTILPDVPERSPFTKDRMAWKLLQLLPQHLQDPRFNSIQQYLVSTSNEFGETENAHSFQQLRLFQLCEKIADVYDNYLMYRPEWLEHWQAGGNDLPSSIYNDDISGHEWQAILWRDLVTFSLEKAQSPYHRAGMHQMLMTKLKELEPSSLRTLLPEKLTVFGISTIPKQQFDILQALSEHICVDIFWLNPCSQYWGDLVSEKTISRLNLKQKEALLCNTENKDQYFVSGNPLLSSWGKVGRDFLEVIANSDANVVDVFIENSQSNCLERIQDEILKLSYRQSTLPLTPLELASEKGKLIFNKGDDSVLIHSCHSPVRELEVLKDQILSWIEREPNINPRDILVMTPDIEKYAPYIHSVFNENDKTKPAIPFTIADRGLLSENPLLDTFVSLLQLPNSRFTLTEIVELLEIPEILAKFELDSSELKLVKVWLDESEIRWGRDGEHKAKWGLPTTDLNTWVYGFKRMLLGLSANDQNLWNDVNGYNKIEGLNAITLGKLIRYFQFIVDTESSLKQSRCIDKWCDWLNAFVEELFEHEQPSIHQLQSLHVIRKATDSLRNYFVEQDFESEVDYGLIHQYFSEQLNDVGVAQRFLAGKVNFCTLMPMRSIPFKIVCVLGLNESDYPRQVDPIGFDLVGLNQARKGDRSRKFDDRYLFLEAMLSAKQKLHLSYLGQSALTNKPLMPSVLLCEIMDYIRDGYIVDKKDPGKSVLSAIVKTHTLQPFDEANFLPKSQENLYISRSEEWYSVAKSQSTNILKASKKEEQCDEPGVDDPINDHKYQSCRQSGSQTDHAEIHSEISVDISELLEFWTHPIKYHYKRVLGVKLELNEQFLQDDEVFEHDALQRFQALQGMLTEQFSGASTSTDATLRSGSYPHGLWGKSMMDSYSKDVNEQLSKVRTLCGLEEDSVKLNGLIERQNISLDVECKGNKIFLSGGVTLFQNKLFLVRTGKIRPQDLVSNWIQHLSLNASGTSVPSLLIGNESKLKGFMPLTQAEARSNLEQWITPFLDAKKSGQLMRWHPKPAFDWLTVKRKTDDPIELNKALLKNLEDSFNRTLSDDDYASKHFTNLSSFDQEFKEYSERLLTSMLDGLVEDKLSYFTEVLSEVR